MGILQWIRGDGPAFPGTGERSELRSAAKSASGAIALDRAPVDLAGLLCTALRPLLSQAAARGITLLISPAADFPRTVRADALKLTWAASALVGSALRFVRAGTRLTPGGTIRVRIGWRAATREAVLEVADDAGGLPPEATTHLLSRDTTPGVVPSLALLLVEDIVHAHGGMLEVMSVHGGPDSGTTVRLIVPCPDAT